MMRNCLLRFASAVSLFFLFSGCKKTSLTAETSPTATPAPVARFQIKPPAFFDIDRVPSDRPSEFELSASAGQVLRVELEDGGREGNIPPAATLSVRTSVGNAVKPITEDFCPNDSLFPLAQNDTYRVLFTPQGAHKSIRFTLLEGTDPLLSPGIRPGQVAIDFGVFEKGGFGRAKTVEAKPVWITCEADDSWPAHLLVQIKDHYFQLRIMQGAGYQELYRDSHDLEYLKASLLPNGPAIDAKKFPYANSGDAATVMTARSERFSGKGWTGWRWIEGSSQDGEYPGGIAYVFEGLTDDGAFLIRFEAAIDHPQVKILQPNGGKTDEETARQDDEHRKALEKSLAVAAPSTFSPSLDELDAVVRSLKIKH
jgi:hypothetical protein